jgi:hypothetical protein
VILWNEIMKHATSSKSYLLLKSIDSKSFHTQNDLRVTLLKCTLNHLTYTLKPFRISSDLEGILLLICTKQIIVNYTQKHKYFRGNLDNMLFTKISTTILLALWREVKERCTFIKTPRDVFRKIFWIFHSFWARASIWFEMTL